MDVWWHCSLHCARTQAAACVQSNRHFWACLLPQDADGSSGPSEYSLELWDASSGTLAAGAASAGAAGCATTPVVDFCVAAGGPAAVQVWLACWTADGRPCSVRVAAFMSPCPGGPPPAAVAVDGNESSGSGSSSSGSSSGGGGNASEGTAQPGDPAAEADGIRGAVKNLGSKDGSGISTTTWIIVGAAAGAAIIAGEEHMHLCLTTCTKLCLHLSTETGLDDPTRPAGTLTTQPRVVGNLTNRLHHTCPLMPQCCSSGCACAAAGGGGGGPPTLRAAVATTPSQQAASSRPARSTSSSTSSSW